MSWQFFSCYLDFLGITFVEFSFHFSLIEYISYGWEPLKHYLVRVEFASVRILVVNFMIIRKWPFSEGPTYNYFVERQRSFNEDPSYKYPVGWKGFFNEDLAYNYQLVTFQNYILNATVLCDNIVLLNKTYDQGYM